MAEEIDESGFYREDFSTESDWEIFNAQLIEIFQAWDLSNAEWGRALAKNELFHCKWQVQTETLELLKKSITVSYYVAELPSEYSVELESSIVPVHQDLMSLENTFGPAMAASNKSDLNTLACLYGLRRFVVMQPTMVTYSLTSPSEFSFFLSSANVVAAEVCSTVPIFVQIYQPKWNYFVGVHVTPVLRINFDLVALETAPPSCKYLSGLLTLFKEKLAVTYKRPAVVSVRNIYSMDTISVRIPMRIPFTRIATEEEGSNSSSIATCTYFTALPYGYFPDSCTEVYVAYCWPEIAENMAIDTELRSDFVPSKAHCGSIHLSVHASSYLTSGLTDFLKLCKATDSLEYFLGRNFSGVASAADVANPLDQLTEHKLPQLRSHRQCRNYAVATQALPKKLSGPMNDNELKQMLFYLFPDMHPDVALFPYAKKSFDEEFDPLRIKSAPTDSLVCRLSCLLATCNAHFGSKSGLAQLWAAFTRELRFLLDNCIRIPGVAPGFPDTRTCLLHQKLQMLNICMERRELRESGGMKMQRAPVQARHSAAEVTSDDDDDDEFYDCTTYDDEQTKTTKSGNEETQSVSANKPEGRQKPLGDMKLLDSDEPLYVPMTQDPVPKTEDQLHDDAEVMLKLGPGSGLTTQMMCSSLLSDMEAFKAANPKAAIEDFIRWYSPRDWIERTDDEGKGEFQLSARMLAPGNTWQTVWQQAQAVPAWRQKRLFDDTNEALKVLHYLETRNIGEIYELTLIPLLHAAVLKLKDIYNNAHVADLFGAQFNEILADLCRLSRDIDIMGQNEISSISTSPNPAPLLEKIKSLELHFYQYKCFENMSGYPYCSQLDDIKSQFRDILENGGSCAIVAKKVGGEGGMLAPNFKNEMHDNLISKEYVIRVDGETTTTSNGQAGPQFLRAIITGEKLRLCGAFAENTTFV